MDRADKEDAKRDRRHMHGKWYRIESVANNAVVYRVLQFDPTLKSAADVPKGDSATDPRLKLAEIAIDRQGWLALIDYDADAGKDRVLTLKISPARGQQKFWAIWHMPSPAERGAFQIAFFLGVLSLVLGLISLVIALLP